MARKNYTEEFRRQAVDLYRSTPGATLRGIATDLGITRGTLAAWVAALDPETTSTPDEGTAGTATSPSRRHPDRTDTRPGTGGLGAGRAGPATGAGGSTGDRERHARHRAGHPAPGGQVFRRGDALVNRFQFVADHRDAFEVKRLCEIVQVARSSFYAWLAAAPVRAVRASADTALAERIRKIHQVDRAQGVPRITAELNDGADPAARVNHKRVARIMRQQQIAGLRLRRRVRTTIPEPANQTVPDLLGRDFTAEAPNQRYVGDITYLPIADGSNLYLATVIDCHSRRLAGWAVAEHMRTDLIVDALSAARDTRGSLAGAIFHSDHGAQGVRPVHVEDLRRPVRRVGRHPVDGRGRHQRRQRAGRVVQRHAQTRDPARWARLARPGDVSARGVPVGDPLQHPPPSLLVRPAVPDQLRAAARRYAAARRVIDHPVSTTRG